MYPRLRRRLLAAASAAWLVLGIPETALAADPSSNPASAGPSAQADPVYRLTVRERRPTNASSTLTVPASDFELRPLESGGQLLEAVPGVVTAQHTGGGKAEQYFLRGFDADHGTDLLVYFDGVPINLRSHAHGQGFIDLHFVTPELIERIDAWKGPYYAEFGDFATAGTIELVPRASLEESLVQVEGGSFDTLRTLSLLSPRTGPFAPGGPAEALVSVEAYHTDGPFRNQEDLWRYSLFARGALELRPGLEISGHLLGYMANWNASGLVPERAIDGQISRFGSFDPTEGGDTRRFQGKFAVEWQPSERRLFRSSAYAVYYDLDLFSNFTFRLGDPVAGDGIIQKDDRLYAGGRSEYREHFDGPVPGRVRAGLEWRFDDARVRLGPQTRRNIAAFTSDDRVRELSVAPYVELDVAPLPWLRLVGAARFEYFRFDVRNRIGGLDDGNADSFLALPKASVILSPFATGSPLESEVGGLRRLELFANFGQGFHSNDARAVVAGRNDTTLPRATGAEIGARTRLFDRIELALDLFWLGLEDELVFVGDEGTTEASGRTRRLGVEFVTRAELASWLTLRGDVAYTSARFTGGGDPVPQAPRLVAKGAVAVRHAGFSAELGLRHLGERYATESSRDLRLESYTVLDFGLRYRWRAFEFGFAIENLTDVHWRSSEFFFASCTPAEVGASAACPPAGGGPGFDDNHFSPGNRRNFRGSVRVYF